MNVPVLGKSPARPDAIKLKFGAYLDKAALPKLPTHDFGHDSLFAPGEYGMLGNDAWGCCVWAGGAHETMIWNKIVGKTVHFSKATIALDYGAVTGFQPSDPKTDQGTDMELAAKYRRQTGMVDVSGRRHRIAAYLSLEAGNIEQHMYAIYLFGAVGIGIEVPSSAMDQFDKGKPWDVVARPGAIEGGHYVPGTSKRGPNAAPNIDVITYGRRQAMTSRFLQKYNDESVVYLSEEALTNRRSAEGFDYDTLTTDLRLVTA